MTVSPPSRDPSRLVASRVRDRVNLELKTVDTPAFKIRGQWRIKRAELDQWINTRPRGGDGGGRGE